MDKIRKNRVVAVVLLESRRMGHEKDGYDGGNICGK